eukprot:CAMPEP_0175084364 /NCGR_PEP_ID=MMETSP0052_2-20121109/28002_1 /TAXON_ID=51329 ORGANISM="Polytomella parva, Strain SAG 63-3" /NCGR_SAMPLE_ID=MMETSP0052_2 /ASSEMBLY_ACC=CAM_ASM_000194 /LENGTH=54 /DNA_ID=CAMNT_0016356127 /DNA_START=162 /DNA_END=327 /DNA_ORIENTATION=-
MGWSAEGEPTETLGTAKRTLREGEETTWDELSHDDEFEDGQQEGGEEESGDGDD